ncbi:MAG TPA: hypothetical protein VK721_13190 [Solirubrobacteraceae bacterium]|jgi:hypothetical protein|nr:hypothetical protein [Solirubrobacteraceae bacterium]
MPAGDSGNDALQRVVDDLLIADTVKPGTEVYVRLPADVGRPETLLVGFQGIVDAVREIARAVDRLADEQRHR